MYRNIAPIVAMILIDCIVFFIISVDKEVLDSMLSTIFGILDFHVVIFHYIVEPLD